MLFTFRFEGKKYAYDSTSGAIMQPSALEFKMMGAIQPPLTKNCPTSLRYELAKYDSMDVEETYGGIYALFEAGVLYIPEDGTIRVCTDGEYAFGSTALIATALTEAFAKVDGVISFKALGQNAESAEKVAAEIAARLGKQLN